METKSGKETITTSDVMKMYDTCRKRPDNKIKRLQKIQCLHCVRKLILRKTFKTRLEKLEEDIKYELSEMLECMHKHSIDDHIMSLEYDLNRMLKKTPETIETDFKIKLEKTLDTMFNDMIPEIIGRMESLKHEIKDKHVSNDDDSSDSSDSDDSDDSD